MFQIKSRLENVTTLDYIPMTETEKIPLGYSIAECLCKTMQTYCFGHLGAAKEAENTMAAMLLTWTVVMVTLLWREYEEYAEESV